MQLLETLISYTRERFPAAVTIPLALVLFGAPASLAGLGAQGYVTGFLTVFLGLLILRIVDDISDIKTDAITNPERGLVTGTIDTIQIKRACLICAAPIVLMNTSWPSLLTVSVTAGSYATFYAIKQRIPLMLRPLFVNMVFGVIPVYASSLKNFYDIHPILLLSLFVWLAVLAHDYAHSVHGPDEATANIESFSDVMGPRRSAILAAILFACSAATGVAFWYRGSAGTLFLTALCCTSALIGIRCTELIKRPQKATARKFYVSGFMFFLIPLMAIGVEALLRAGHA